MNDCIFYPEDIWRQYGVEMTSDSDVALTYDDTLYTLY